MKVKFQTLLPWMSEILGSIKKDIKSDYLSNNPAFCRAHFGNLPMSRITAEEINDVFSKELLNENEELSQWVIDRWVYKHGDIYQHFASRLFEINPEFDEITALTKEESAQILAGAKEAFGARDTYVFSVLNGVVFPETVLQQLRKETEEEVVQEKVAAEERELAKLIEKHQREIERLQEKHEQKLAGALRKYTADVTALKKQLLALQSK